MITVSDISKNFDGVQALYHVSASFAPGEVHALVGENGAGKSTLGKIIAGVYPPTSGRCTLDGRSVAFATTLEAQRVGICMIFQELDLFPNLSVAENIVIGNLNAGGTAWVNFRKMADWCRPFLKQVELTLDPAIPVGTLAMGHQQLVAIARALSMNARFLVMDEPTSSLGNEDVEALFHTIDNLRKQGVGIIYVSHRMDEVFRIADHITVLRDGQCIGRRAIAETDRKEVMRMMVGREVNETAKHHSTATAETLLAFEQVCTHRLQAISFELKRGEVLGVAGLTGSGRSQIGRALFGLDELTFGRMYFKGQDYVPADVRDAMAAGVALQPEDRKTEGLMMQMSAQENTSLSSLLAYSRYGWIHTHKEHSFVSAIHQQIKLMAESPGAAVGTLSGGNQQKALLARWLLRDPELFFFDDPTRGIDVVAKQDIYAMIAEQAARGKGVIYVSSELPELLRCCDQILVMNGGRCSGILNTTEATQEAIMALAAK